MAPIRQLVVIGLGSNLGDSLSILSNAVTGLRHLLDDLTLSHIYSSDPQLPENAPADWASHPFLNMAVRGSTNLSPHALLAELKALETRLGRSQNRGTWAPREIDLDILSYGNEIISDGTLTIPHAHLLSRPFAIWPFADVAPGWTYPIKGEYYNLTALELSGIFQVADAPFGTARTNLSL